MLLKKHTLFTKSRKLNLPPMKRSNYIFIPVFLLLSSLAFSQPQAPVREKVESMKVGFLTERLNLTSEEAKVFWPVYNKYEDELEVLRTSRRENLMNAKKNFDEMNDRDIEKAVDNEIAFRQNELDLLKKFHPQFKQVLPIKKVAKLYRAEEDFKRKLLDMIQEKRERKEERRGFKK
jgi:hypothetical protein